LWEDIENLQEEEHYMGYINDPQSHWQQQWQG
jgi:hypothetical protein